ncbi:hypothetical protein VULLAG_LOCUS14045 [Vulpes lagopus]
MTGLACVPDASDLSPELQELPKSIPKLPQESGSSRASSQRQHSDNPATGLPQDLPICASTWKL